MFRKKMGLLKNRKFNLMLKFPISEFDPAKEF